jgi:hypothetical protein
MRDMKKIILSLIVILGLFVSACSPRFAYFTTETPCPQCIVDSLLQPNKYYYHNWAVFQTVGINHGDSTIISTYVFVKDNQTIKVVEYDNDYYVTVSEKKKLK